MLTQKLVPYLVRALLRTVYGTNAFSDSKGEDLTKILGYKLLPPTVLTFVGPTCSQLGAVLLD